MNERPMPETVDAEPVMCSCGAHDLLLDGGLVIVSLTDTSTCPSSNHGHDLCRYLTPVE